MKIKRLLKKLKYNLEFLGVLNSPLHFPNISIYIGKTAISVPCFLPRKWRMDKTGTFKAYPLKFGFSYNPLIWKTKFDDYRYEYSPTLSFVCGGFQIAITIKGESPGYVDSYWETWLYYKYNTSGSKVERLKQCMKNNSLIWISYEKGISKEENHYEKILKEKYKKFINYEIN